MSTMTLEQVRDCLRAYNIDADEYHGKFFAKSMADAIDAHLRESEEAKAGVTDEMVQRAIFTAEECSNATRIGWNTMRAALEAIAPMLASARVPDRCPHGIRYPHPCRDCEDGE